MSWLCLTICTVMCDVFLGPVEESAGVAAVSPGQPEMPATRRRHNLCSGVGDDVKILYAASATRTQSSRPRVSRATWRLRPD